MKKLLILLICSGCTLTISIQPIKKKVVSDWDGITYGGIINGLVYRVYNGDTVWIHDSPLLHTYGPLTLPTMTDYDCLTCPVGHTIYLDTTFSDSTKSFRLK